MSLRTDRPSRSFTYIEIAKIISLRATCQRGKVGAVITVNDRIVSTGYNGILAGTEDCEKLCNIKNPCQHAVHAEVNAICAAAKEGIALKGAKLYITVSPCDKCANIIVQSGIAEVVYLGEYRESQGITILESNEIKVNRYVPIEDNN